MGQTYTPGLKVAESTTVRKRRLLPIKGDVLVTEGQEVEPDHIVAKTDLPGDVYPINVANTLGIGPAAVPEAMLKKVGDLVQEGEDLARAASFFGLFKSTVKSPKTGTIENVSSITGQVILRGAPLPVQVSAYIPGKVTDVREGEGVTVMCRATFIQGIFGIGGECTGSLRVLVDNASQPLDASSIKEEHAGCILVGGSMATAEALKRAEEVGAYGIVAGGFDDRDLRDYLGYDLGVAITGSEDIGITLVVTEGFGEISMAEKTFDLLKNREGRQVSINGATQIRAGVIRPEVVIPISGEESQSGESDAQEACGLQVGATIRCIRNPYFGNIGKVIELPSNLVRLESETRVRTLRVRLQSGEECTIPRANVELIEGE